MPNTPVNNNTTVTETLVVHSYFNVVWAWVSQLSAWPPSGPSLTSFWFVSFAVAVASVFAEATFPDKNTPCFPCVCQKVHEMIGKPGGSGFSKNTGCGLCLDVCLPCKLSTALPQNCTVRSPTPLCLCPSASPLERTPPLGWG